MNIKEAKEFVMGAFNETYEGLINKIEKYKKTGTFSASILSEEWEYKNFSEVLNRGFASEKFKDLFFSMFMLHYTLNVDYSIDARKYGEKELLEYAGSLNKMHESSKVLRAHVRKILRDIKCPKVAFLKKADDLLEHLKVLSYAKKQYIEHAGDNSFLASKIIIENKPFSIPKGMSLDPRIMYTNNPEQLISLAHVAKPGAYLVACVPYGRWVEMAFYLIIRTDHDAYCVDFGKHSYREQIYRTSSKGEGGKERWFDRKTEHIYYPIKTVFDFFDNKSDKKDLVIPDKEFPFHVIGNFRDEEAITYLWTLMFLDDCLVYLKDENFMKKLSPAVSVNMVLPVGENKENLPAHYKANLPAIKEKDLKWSAKSLDIDYYGNDPTPYEKALAPMDVHEIDLRDVPVNALSSLEQAKGHLVYQRRLQQKNKLEKALWVDFKKNHVKVKETLTDLVMSRDKEWILMKALRDLKYGRDVKYREAFHNVDYHGEHILFYHGLKTYQYLKCSGKGKTNLGWIHNDYRQLRIAGDYDICGYCLASAKEFYLLKFTMPEQFIEFFELTEKEQKKVPSQFMEHLRPERQAYQGNYILDDVDPLTDIVNPWWILKDVDRSSFNPKKSWEEHQMRSDAEPMFMVGFVCCTRCKNKYLRRIAKA